MRNGVPVHVNNKKTLHKKDFDTTTKSKQCNYNWPRNTVLLWPCCGLNVKQLQHLVTKGVTIFQLIFYANTLKAVFQWYVFFYVRIRTECSEHVNSFIDAYWAHVRKRTLKRTHHWKTAFRMLWVRFPSGAKKSSEFPKMLSNKQIVLSSYLKARLHRRFLWRSFSFWCMRLNGLTFECIRPSVQSYTKSILLWLNHSIACVRMRKISTKIARVNGPLSCVYTLWLIGPISYPGEWDLMVQMHFAHECILLPSHVYNIHQDTKSARLITVCKRSFNRLLYLGVQSFSISSTLLFSPSLSFPFPFAILSVKVHLFYLNIQKPQAEI